MMADVIDMYKSSTNMHGNVYWRKNTMECSHDVNRDRKSRIIFEMIDKADGPLT